MIVRTRVYLMPLVLLALLICLAAPMARAQTPAATPSTPVVPAANLPQACRDAGGALVVTTTPFTRDRDKQARPTLLSPDGKPLGEFPVPGAL